MRCLSTGPGRFWLEDEPEVSWPARCFGPRRNSWDSPQVDQATLVALLAHLLIVGHGVTAFHLDAAGVVSVLDEVIGCAGCRRIGTACTTWWAWTASATAVLPRLAR